MDVLQVNKFYPPVIGGIEAHVGALAEGLAGRDHVVSALVSRPRGCSGTERRNEVRVRRVASLGTLASTPVAPTYPLSYYRATRGVEVLHHHLPNPVGVAAHLATPEADARTVATYHSDIVRQRRALTVYRPLLQRFLSRIDRIVVTSPRLLEYSPVLARHRNACRVVPLSIPLDRFTPGQSAAVPLPVDPDEPFVLFVGRLAYYKGVEYLLEAMANVDAPLVIVGDGERREYLERRASERTLTDRVHFLGEVSDEVLHRCYDCASVFVLPSVERSEAFGIVQLEAMAYETPVVNTALPTGVPWVSQDEKTGLTVPPRDAEALGSAIRRLFSDDGLRSRYGRAARDRVETNFTRERMVDRMETVYREL